MEATLVRVSQMATAAEDEYLQTIFWLEEAELPMTGANVARAMQVSAPTVHEMVGRLESDGFITRNPDKSIEFTDSGREQAGAIVRRHRLIERFLTDVLGIPWDERERRAVAADDALGVLEARLGEADRLARRALDVAVALEAHDHLVHRRGRELHRARDVRAGHRQARLLQPEERLEVLLLGDGGVLGGHLEPAYSHDVAP